MMVVWALAACCAAAALRTLLIAARFVRLFKSDAAADEVSFAPPARVVLCLRGADPFLRDCIAGLLAQRYPRYELVIVVDSVDDPAWQVAHEATASAMIPVTIKPLQVRSKRRSLLMSSMLEAVSDLPDECEAVVIADADVITAETWLESLVKPLQDSKIAVATGVRWCVPETAEWGTLVRYMWNSFAEPQRHTHQIPWGGSLCIRREVVDVARNGRFWQQAFCADLTLTPILADRKLRVRIVPEAVSAVRETISLRPCLSFLARQMTWVRLYHPRWLAILLDSFLLATPAMLGFVALGWSFVSGFYNIAALVAGITLAYSLALCLTHFWVEHHVFQVIRRHGDSTSSPLAAWIKCFIAAPLLPPLYSACAIYAHFRRRVSWRGIQYQYRGPWDIDVQVDRPFESTQSQETASMV